MNPSEEAIACCEMIRTLCLQSRLLIEWCDNDESGNILGWHVHPADITNVISTGKTLDEALSNALREWEAGR